MSVHLYTRPQFVAAAMDFDGLAGTHFFVDFLLWQEILRLKISSWKLATEARVLARAGSRADHNCLDGLPPGQA